MEDPKVRIRLSKDNADRLRRDLLPSAWRSLPKEHPFRVLALIPRSHFTKTGPGVRASSRRAFFSFMSAAQRRVAVARGWYPASMLPRSERTL